MATLHPEGRGRYAVRVKTPDGRRYPIRLGKLAKRTAETIHGHIGELEHAARYGTDCPASTRRWLAEAGPDLLGKLAKAGLVELAEGASVTLGEAVERWLAMKAGSCKVGTQGRLRYATEALLVHFGPDRPIDRINAGDADEWHAQARARRRHSGRLAEATRRKYVSDARGLFAFCMRKGWHPGPNPFSHLPVSHTVDDDRQVYVSEATARRVMDALQGSDTVPTWELRALLALARWGGMRTPSEPGALRWADVDFSEGRITLDAPKTGRRILPLFPELREPLMQAFEHAEPGSEHVLPSARRLSSMGIRKYVEAAIKRAGVELWPRLFNALRSSRETDLVSRHPLHAVVKWLGNSQPTALKHYLVVNDEHFRAAVEPEKGVEPEKVVRNPVRALRPAAPTEGAEPPFEPITAHCAPPNTPQTTPHGFEP